jgi:hypothetical protein
VVDLGGNAADAGGDRGGCPGAHAPAAHDADPDVLGGVLEEDDPARKQPGGVTMPDYEGPKVDEFQTHVAGCALCGHRLGALLTLCPTGLRLLHEAAEEQTDKAIARAAMQRRACGNA